MRKFSLLLLLVVMLSATQSFALRSTDRGINRSLVVDGTDHRPVRRGFLCEECRDLNEYPMDAVAYAYNGFFGEFPWMRSAGLGIPFRIYTVDGVSVLVWFEGVLFDAPSLLPDLMEVMVRMPDGRVLKFSILQNGPDLPIGVPEVPPITPPVDAHGTGGNGGGGEDDDYEEPDELEDIEFEDPDHIGQVDIIDPDDDGVFPDWLEEL
jgi:hypothetical protein